ncbi:MAG TPA: 16S rRNA (guanine(527)-N(7))-methyltransferase RsmG [Pseudobdellovibrionaceae bacterium]|mgnify:CR=1 FL=1|nr:16S rRNA (guanine(527)-N(7))-methyltransferase RsmG [Pseudobdellovibrionaceae bacterium]
MSEIQAPQWRIDEWFQVLERQSRDKMRIFHDEIHKYNRTLNLISAKTLPFTDAIHFADSILGSQLIHQSQPDMTRIYDLGSGSGFPGLIFAILYSKVEVVLVEADQKKCEFLNHVIDQLQLKNVKVLNQQIETLEPNSVRFCMARGLSTISKSILLTRKIVPVGGVFFHFKGENWSAEVGEIPTQLCSVWMPALVGDYKLPVGPLRFGVVKTDKIA